MIKQVDNDKLRETIGKYKSAGLTFDEFRTELRKEWAAYKRGAVEPELYEEARRIYLEGTQEINIVISERDRVYGHIRNGPEGVLRQIRVHEQVNAKGESEERRQVIEVFRYSGSIGPVVRVDGEKIGIRYDLNGDEGNATLDEIRPVLKRHFSLTPGKMQAAMEVLSAYVIQESRNGKVETVYRNVIHIVGSTIECDYEADFNIGIGRPVGPRSMSSC